MNNEPVVWLEPITGNVLKDAEYQNNPFANETGDWIPLYTNPVKELRQIKGINYYVDAPVKELTYADGIEECAQRAEAYAYMSPNFTALAEELRAILRKAQEK